MRQTQRPPRKPVSGRRPGARGPAAAGPDGEFTGVHYVALGVTNPTKWDPLTSTETCRDILDGSEKPSADVQPDDPGPRRDLANLVFGGYVSHHCAGYTDTFTNPGAGLLFDAHPVVNN
ncbi:MAG: hypothetical protein QNJ77_08775 [Acidimicrobiia bacterium]|nr:hypothetical protein [Acidimicrobiia bacterium]